MVDSLMLMVKSAFMRIGSHLFGHGEDVVRAEDLVFLAIEFDFGAAILADEHAVALLDFEWNLLAIVIGLAGAEGHDQTFHGFFLCGIGDNDPALFGFLLFDRF